MLPNITIMSLGGTIAMTPDENTKGVVPKLTAADLVSTVPELQEIATIEAQTFRNIPSAHMELVDIEALAVEIKKHVRDGAQGIVVTQGTDTIEESAQILDLLLDVEVPVVVTGAMRNPSRPGSDGPANLLGAVQVASSPEARNLGTLVVFNDEIHAARFVTKAHTSNVAAFSSAPLGPIGYITEDRVRILLRPIRVSPIIPTREPFNVCVPIIKISLGDDATMIKASAQAGVDGLVLEAMGGGHVSPTIADALETVAAKLPVILTSRAGQGENLVKTYGYVGSEMDLISRGLLSGGRHTGTQARVLLMLLLRHDNLAHVDIRASMHPYF